MRLKYEHRCALCGRPGQRGFKADWNGDMVCIAATACMRRYRDNATLRAAEQ